MRIVLLAFVAALSVGASASGATPAQQPAAPAGERLPFDAWVDAFRADAIGRGISRTLLDTALDGLEPLERVLESDRQQAELVVPFEKYLTRTVTPATIRQARAARAEHRDLLERVQQAYGVPPGIIVAIWGLESRFGHNTGRTSAVQALATLAWDSRRSNFFRDELLGALRIVDAGHIELDRLKGSWAGAMGQPQFMPSSYLAYAEDFDGDGRRDIWGSTADVFASIANYLAKNGWQAGLEWGREVAVTRNQLRQIRRQVPYRTSGCYAMRDTTEERPVAAWRKLGVRQRNGRPLPLDSAALSLVTDGARSFVVTPSYFAILRYNCAHHYALSAGLLSVESGKPEPRQKPTPRRPRRPRR